MFTDFTKIQLVQTLSCIVLSILFISIIPKIKSIFVKNNGDEGLNSAQLPNSHKYSNLIFNPNQEQGTYKKGFLCEQILFYIIVIFTMILENIFIKISLPSAFVCFVIALELILFTNWPIKLSIKGLNEYELASQNYYSSDTNHNYNLQRYVRLLIFIPVCVLMVSYLSFNLENTISCFPTMNILELVVTYDYSILLIVCIQNIMPVLIFYKIFNLVIQWISTKLIFVSSEEKQRNLLEAFSFSREGLTILVLLSIASLIFLKWINNA